MGQETWDLIKKTKGFYINTYHVGGSVLVVSVLFNLLLGLMLFYLYCHQPSRDFYATDGVTPPVALTPLDSANKSSVPLLAGEVSDDDGSREIPK